MPAEVDASGSWVHDAVKGMGMVVVALFGWIWRTSHKNAIRDAQHRSLEKRVKRIEAGVGRILDHMTGTKLHEIEVEDDK